MSTVRTRPTTELFGEAYFQDPHPAWEWLRRNDPVHSTMLPGGGTPVWLVSRYDEVKSILLDESFSNSFEHAPVEFREYLGLGAANTPGMTQMDPPEHTHLRGLVSGLFTARHVQNLEDEITTIVDHVLDDLTASRGRPMDAVLGLAWMISTRVACHALGTPHSQARELSIQLYTMMSTDPDTATAADRAKNEVRSWLRRTVVEAPGGYDGGLARTLAANGELDTERLLDLLMTMIEGCTVSPANLLSMGLLILLDHPEQLAALRARPDGMTAVIEEMLRYESVAATSLWRFPRTDCTIAGRTIAAYEPVWLLLGSANRDPARFERPDEFDPLRPNNNTHLAFGRGRHSCFGSALAQLEARIFFTRLLERFDTISLAVNRADVRFRHCLMDRALAALPIVADKER
ncbi:cytochrome P450 [Amycolatopsis sp. NPDC102389]|uniref:cytochrome P450 n=1 Tax=Amycolatopsis sp. NPDC102389 TaxID=3363941 RepID=UPI0037FC340C